MESCFQNMNRFSWIKLIPVLTRLKYWYCNNTFQEVPCFPHHFYNTILIMFFISFPILFNPIWPHTTSIWYTKPCAKSSHLNFLLSYRQMIKIYRSNMLSIEKLILIRTASLSKLDNTLSSNSIFNTKYAKFFIK